MQGLKVGHYTNEAQGTGVSVFLFDQPATGAYVLCGSGPASHELAPLDPEASVSVLHGLMLAGGSAFGLTAVRGVMQYLTERKIGLTLPHGVVPIVPAAAIYDLAYKHAEAPTDKQAYAACEAATSNNYQSGRIGAGTGATIGKIVPNARHMTAGLGFAALMLHGDIEVMAYVVVNAIGDVRGENNQIIAGGQFSNGQFADCTKFLLQGKGEELIGGNHRGHTTLAAVFTNAAFSKSELKRIAKMAVAGLARSISPVFTCYDGDIVFAISIGEKEASVLTVGVSAAEAIAQAVRDAVKTSEVI
jgi:L-aminopeptidase/D-esterase-like protein